MIFASYLFLLAITVLHPIEAFAPGLAEYRIVLVLSLVVLAMSVFGAVRNRTMAARPRHLILLGALMVAIMISRVATGWAGGAVPALIEFSAPALLFVVTILVVTTTERLRKTCAVLVLCMIMLSIAGIAAYHKGFMRDELVVAEHGQVKDELTVTPSDVIPADDDSGTTLWRIHSWGFLSDPNDFSQAIVMVLPMLMGAWLRRRSLRNLVRIWVPCALLIYASYLTHSRGAILGLSVVILFGLMRKLGRFRAGLLLALFGFAAAVVGFTGGRSFSSEGASAGGRIAAWSEGLTMLGSHPFVGVGFGNFTEHFYYTAHNSFVLCFAELGLLGYFFWVGMIVLVFKEMSQAAQLAPEDSPERRWAILLRLSLLGFLTCALFLSRTYQPTLYILLGLCIASWHCAEKTWSDETETPMPAVPWIASTIGTMIASIIIIYMIVRFQNTFVL
ncbi:MAG TPA: O-antigen ligase family protein [Dokdonella sp.]|uniref:O-antigen ligase family protein n=1 Tax=Dokdonella sp. TaxID=2291710 RepID=UPI002D7E9940|nr:O-antigen ligase family protein [Dokdonella sp.]HET9032654.1 O-antigen ligase family protein [Dokdonella sp.]